LSGITPHGIIPALNTLTTAQGELDLNSLRSLVRQNIKWRAHGFAVSIVAGEFYKFSDDERKRTFKTVVDECGGRVPVWAGVSHLGTDPALQLARYAKEIGADGIIAMPGLVAKEASFSLYEHFKSLLEGIDLPLMIQDSEDFNGIHMCATLYEKLAEQYSNLIAVKVEGDHTLEKIREIRHVVGNRLTIISGKWAMLLFQELKLGAQGTIPDGCLTDILVEAYDDYMNGNLDKANRTFKRYKRWVDFVSLHSLSFHEIEKETLLFRGVINSTNTRYPCVKLDETAKQELKDLLTDIEVSITK